MRLPDSFYLRQDVTLIARELLGKVIVTRDGSGLATSGRITEVEAYAGWGDRACHAANGKRTRRNATMYRSGGVSYVYLCYGLHALMNVVTNLEGHADAVLIRAIEPLEGIDMMMKRRSALRLTPALTAGPARLTQALGITVAHDGMKLGHAEGVMNPGDALATASDEVDADVAGHRFTISIVDDGWRPHSPGGIVCGPRIGVAYAGDDALKPWRFAIAGSGWISSPRGNDCLASIV